MAFLPPHFQPPTQINTETFLLRPITIHDVIKDYDAVMSSRDHLWERFGEMWGWPSANLSLEQDMIDLAWHQKEAQLHSSFNYAVISPDQSQLLGCVYVDPPVIDGTEADVWFWARQSELAGGLESKLEPFITQWLADHWPFQIVSLNKQVIQLKPDRTI